MLLAGPISHTSIQYMDFIEIFYVSLDFSTIYFAHFNGCIASLCLVVTLSQNAIPSVPKKYRTLHKPCSTLNLDILTKYD